MLAAQGAGEAMIDYGVHSWDVAAVVPGVEHVEVDAEDNLELVRRLGVLRTPTTIVLDQHGQEVTRASGALRKEQVLAALAKAVPDEG